MHTGSLRSRHCPSPHWRRPWPAAATSPRSTTTTTGTTTGTTTTTTTTTGTTTGTTTTHDHDHGRSGWWSGGHTHGPGGHTHGPEFGRRGLVGMGIAGGLVPSPSALVVLLASIALGRTAFGVVLVVAYGLGMAGTLTAVGLLLVHLRARLDAGASRLSGSRLLSRLTLALPVLTAGLVFVVGVSLVVRGAVLGA